LDGWNSGLQTIVQLTTLLNSQGIALPRLDEEVSQADKLPVVRRNEDNDVELYDYLPRSFAPHDSLANEDDLQLLISYVKKLNSAVKIKSQ